MTARTDFGKHYLVDLSQCDPDKISWVGEVRQIFLQAAGESKAKMIASIAHGADVPSASVTAGERTLWLLDKDAASGL